MPIHQNKRYFIKETSETLMEVEVIAGENPAHRIIRNAVKNRDKNDPENLGSFSYTSYNKLVIMLEADSLPLYNAVGDFDSSNFRVQNFMDQRHLFLMETASERKYKKPNKDTERVIANRVSGFKIDKLTMETSTGSERSFIFIFRFANITSKFTTMAITGNHPFRCFILNLINQTH